MNGDIQAQKHYATNEAVKRANADPLPGPLANAFGGELVHVGPFAIRPLVAYDMALLKKLDSPLYHQMLEAAKPAEEQRQMDWTDEDGYEMVYQFSRTPSECRAALAKGREHFREMACQSVADIVDPMLLAKAVEVIAKQIQGVFETAIKFGAAEEGETRFFQEQPKPTLTDSVGG